jgi:tetratricopeptide (TPR) repeat protein
LASVVLSPLHVFTFSLSFYCHTISEEAAQAFDRVFELRPTSYLWQAGIVKYYLDELEEAADIFARNAVTYESKFGLPATEERIWRHACELKLMSSLDKRERKRVQDTGGVTLPQIPDKDCTAELLRSESRMALRTARNMFNATVFNDYSALILSRAKLRSMAGPAVAFDSSSSSNKPLVIMDKKMWKIQSWFYLGLHYDALGEADESKKCMKMALRLRPSSGKADDIVHTLPMLHMSQREWFDDDDDFDSDLFSISTTTNSSSTSSWKSGGARNSDNTATTKASRSVSVASAEHAMTDPVFVESMKVGIAQLRLPELQDALRLRGIPAGVGSKDELREKLFESMLGDTGLR